MEASVWDADQTAPFSAPDFQAIATLPVLVRGDQPSEVLPGLLLGGHPARYSVRGQFSRYPAKHLAETWGVQMIVNCCAAPSAAPLIIEDLETGEKSPSTVPTRAAGKMLHVNVPMVDEDDYPIAADLPRVVALIVDALVPLWRELLQSPTVETRSAVVLVHCQMGVSRSATVVAAVLMWAFQGLALQDAIAHAVSRRSCVSPNPGFLAALESLEPQLLSRPLTVGRAT